MTMWHIHKRVKHILTSIAVLAMTTGLASCEAVYEDQSDCAMRYRVEFRFVKNILHTDAFGSQVTRVHLNVYDKEGKLVVSKTEERTLSEINDYSMEVDVVPGNYDLVAWCEGEALADDHVAYSLEDGSNIKGFRATLPVNGETSSSDIKRLFHGASANVEFPEKWGVNKVGPVYLTRDTNHITVMVQNMDGMPLDPEQFNFEITGNNNRLDWDNSVMPESDIFTYTPWNVQRLMTENNPEVKSRGTMEDSEMPSGVLADFTTSRLMADMPQRLTISLVDSGEEILSIPLVDYLLLVKGNYKEETDQDYLDSYDDYTMVFFIDKGMTWIKARVYINGWRVVPPQEEEM